MIHRLAFCACQRSVARGFTLAELLIALAILGVIATFTIPKILTASQNSKKVAIAKEAAAILSGAYEAYKLEHTPTADTQFSDLTPYLNYVRIDTSSVIDNDDVAPNTYTCNATDICYALHNGAIIAAENDVKFDGTNATNSIFLYVDPDGKYTADRAVTFFLYFNGKLTSGQHTLPGTDNSDGWGGGLADPSWFSWD